MPKYIVPVASPDGQQGDELEIEADSAIEAMAVAQRMIDEGHELVSKGFIVGKPRYA